MCKKEALKINSWKFFNTWNKFRWFLFLSCFIQITCRDLAEEVIELFSWLKHNCKDHPIENEYHGFLCTNTALWTVSQNKRTTRRAARNRDTDVRGNWTKGKSFWWIGFHYNNADVSLDWIRKFLKELDKMISEMNFQTSTLELKTCKKLV